jgi:hypothetical protein
VPGLRPGGLSSATRDPLEKGVACRFPPRFSGSISACNASIWRCSSATKASSASRLNVGRCSGLNKGGNIDFCREGRKTSR